MDPTRQLREGRGSGPPDPPPASYAAGHSVRSSLSDVFFMTFFAIYTRTSRDIREPL